MQLTILGQNIAAWRDLVGLSQAEVSTRAALPRAKLSQIESGKLKPTPDDLKALSKVFDIGLLDLVKPPRVQLEKIRFRSTKKLKSRNEILAKVSRDLDAYAQLEVLLNENRNISKIESISSLIEKLDTRSPENAAAIARQELFLDHKNSQDVIRDLCGLLEKKAQVKVMLVDLRNPDFFGLSVRDEKLGAAIVVNCWERISVERQIFTLAHELGHLLMHKFDFDPQKMEEEKSIEEEADKFASYFLMPRKLFEEEYRDAQGLSLFDRVLKLKRLFRVSYKTILYRLYECYGQKNIWKNFQFEAKKSLGKTLSKIDEPLPCTSIRSEECEEMDKHDFVPDRRNLLALRAVIEDKISVSRAAEILNSDLDTIRFQLNSWQENTLKAKSE